MASYILAHDLGTSGNKATLFDRHGAFITSHVYHYEAMYYGSLRAEQDPQDWWKAICVCTRKILEKVKSSEIAAVVFSGQMQGCLCVDQKGNPLHNSMIYCDQRSFKETDFLIETVGAKKIYSITGHRPSPTYSLEKLLWIKNNHPEIFNRTSHLLQAKEFIIAKLTGSFITEQNDASGTNAFDITTLDWSDEILSAVKIPKTLFPELHDSIDVVGHVTSEGANATGLQLGTPVVAGAGDGGCATIGAGSIAPGISYSYLGSSGWTSSTATAPLEDEEMRTFSWAHPIRGYYQLCGTVQTAGNCLKWFVENVMSQHQEEEKYELLDSAIQQVAPGSQGLIFLPYLMGERTPWWNIKARGCWLGLHQQSDWKLMGRSLLEGVALNLAYTYNIFSDFIDIKRTRLIGGAARTRSLVQILANILQIPIDTLQYLEESTSLGSAIIGGVGVSLYDSFDITGSFNPVHETFEPDKKLEGIYKDLQEIFKNSYYANQPIFDQLFDFVEKSNNVKA